MARDIVEKLEFGCPFKAGTLGEKDAELAEVVMQEGVVEITRLRAKVEQIESQRDGYKLALENMVALWERVHGSAPIGKPTVNAAKKVLAAV